MTLKILVEEEYGYRYWLWHYPGTISQLKSDWEVGAFPNPHRQWNKYSRTPIKQLYTESYFLGDLERLVTTIDLERLVTTCDAFMRVFEFEDTILKINGLTFKLSLEAKNNQDKLIVPFVPTAWKD